MRGKYTVIVQSKRLRYEFTIRRNITIIRGNSATGKTTLIEQIAAFEREGRASGVEVNCERKCCVLDGTDWQDRIKRIQGQIVFIDECHRFTASEEFAAAIRASDNYYVIVAREGLPNLPYSIHEIYGIRSSGHYAGLKQIYQVFYHIYGDYDQTGQGRIHKMIIEDSNAGFDFLSEMTNVSCISANGKSNIPKLLRKTTDQEEMVVVVADGAAIGCEMEKIERIREGGKKVILYVPESFEWLILSSGLIDGNRIAQVLEAPEEHIDSEQFFSWERFFTSLLVQETQDTYLHYSKSRLNPAYLQEKQSRPILDRMRPLMELLSGEDTSGGRFASGDGSSV